MTVEGRKEQEPVDLGPGKLEVITGSMFSGKTDELIRRLRRAEIARQTIQVFYPAIDDRYDVEKITSHAGHNFDATPVQNIEEIRELVNPIVMVVAIDEAQFFDDNIVPFVHELASKRIRVIVAGLDTNFRGEEFGPVPNLMAQAERVDKLHAICMTCGNEANYTQRLINGTPARVDDPVIQVGASEMYEARCREHHEVPGKP